MEIHPIMRYTGPIPEVYVATEILGEGGGVELLNRNYTKIGEIPTDGNPDSLVIAGAIVIQKQDNWQYPNSRSYWFGL
jgi:hypothetical protein